MSADPVRELDVVIVGAGPAGSACAAASLQLDPSKRVCLIERTHFAEPRPGEVLPAEALPLLRQIGYPVQKLRAMSTPCVAIASSWGNASTLERHHLFSAAGPGHHVERSLFDGSLCAHAESLGVDAWRDAAVCSITPEPVGWRIALQDGRQISAAFLVDATGRNCAVARMLGSTRHTLDTLMSYSCYVADRGTYAGTVVEATQDGWWYSAPLPSQRRIVTFLTDVDLGRGLGLPLSDAWLRLLRQTADLGRSVPENEETAPVVVRPAGTSLLSQPGGERWLATGDALASCDPLAAQGITRGLYSGILAAYAVHDALAGDGGQALERYAGVMTRHLQSYLQMHAIHYARENRWPQSEFWTRRHRGSKQAAA